MSKLTKFTLASLVVSTVAAVLFLTGVINVAAIPGLYVVFPLAAILYGGFLICLALDKEVARFDAEQRAHLDSAQPDIQPHNVESLYRPRGSPFHRRLTASRCFETGQPPSSAPAQNAKRATTRLRATLL